MPPSRVSIPPEVFLACPACRMPVDMLRAGHVAMLDGEFRYFCNAECKASYLDASSRREALDAVTASPPLVAATLEGLSAPVPHSREVVSSGVVEKARSSEVPPEVWSEALPVEESTQPTEAVRAISGEEDDPDDDPDERDERDEDRPTHTGPEPDPEPDPGAPRTLRSVAGSRVSRPGVAGDPVDGAHLPETLVAALPVVAVASGGLAALLALLGDAGHLARVVSAVVACVAAGVLVSRKETVAAGPRRVLEMLAPAAALSAMAWALVVKDVRAPTYATLAGLSAATVAFTRLLLRSVRTPLGAAQDEISASLRAPAFALRGDETTEIDADDVKPGEQVLVVEGQTVPVDGLVTAGEADVVPWPGARHEATKREGDAIVAGARVLSGRLRIRATFTRRERAFCKGFAGENRLDAHAPLVVALGGWLTRAALLASVLVASAIYATGGSVRESLAGFASAAAATSAWALPVILSLYAASIVIDAYASGVVYRDARSFDLAGRTDVAVYCSRGTLLLGEPEVVGIEAFGPHETDGDRVLALASGAETGHSHPVALAVSRAARLRGVHPEAVRNTSEVAGLGVTALSSAAERILVGGRALFLQERVSIAASESAVAELEAVGRSVLLVALGGKLIGLIALQDGLRVGARASVQRLLGARIEPVLMSGESRETCESLARSLSIDHVRPDVLPNERADEVKTLAEGGHVVAVIGHATADEAALRAAEVSVALSTAGAAPAEWTVLLASDDVRDAAIALAFAKSTRERMIRAAVLGLLPGAVAILAMGFGLGPLLLGPIAGASGAILAISGLRGQKR